MITLSIQVSSKELEAIQPLLRKMEETLTALRVQSAEREEDSRWRGEMRGE